MTKRILSFITLLAMMLSLCVFCLPAGAGTQPTIWDGTEVEPTADSDGDGFIDLTLPSHLAWVVANDGNGGGKYELLNDIYLNDITVNASEGTYVNNADTAPRAWYTAAVGTGKSSATFNGTIAGNGYTVHGLFYDDDTVETELTSPGLVPYPKNLTITDLKIDNSYVVKTGGSSVAAFSGRTHQITATYLRCMVGANVYIKGGTTDAGGIAGGGGSGSYVTITDCVSLANIVSAHLVGGMVGDSWNATGWKVNNCYTTSARLVGSSATFSNSANNYSVSGCNNSTSLTTGQMTGQNAKTNMAFDFENVWMVTAGYPIPRVFYLSEDTEPTSRIVAMSFCEPRSWLRHLSS